MKTNTTIPHVSLKLLGQPLQNTKLAKSGAKGYLTYGLSLAPSNVSGYQVCPNASAGCIKACIFTSGRGNMPNVSAARIRKTKLFFEQREEFLAALVQDILKAERHASSLGMRPAFRLNVFSDIAWEEVEVTFGASLLQMFPNVQFYDYTKDPRRMEAFLNGDLPNNYHLTFSRSEKKMLMGRPAEDVLHEFMDWGGQVAFVYEGEQPEHFLGYQTIDGDEHDLRFLDKNGVAIGLKAKGQGKADTTGFVLQTQEGGAL